MALNELPAFLQAFLLFALIFQAAVTDLSRRKIFNLPVLIALLGGLVLAWWRGGVGGVYLLQFDETVSPVSLLDALAGLLVLFAPFFIAYMTGGMGAGDAKLAAAVGALTGLRFSLWVLFNTALVGAGLAIICLLFNRQFFRGLRRSLRVTVLLRRREKDEEQVGKPLVIPYAVAIALGTLVTVWLFHSRGYPLPFM